MELSWQDELKRAVTGTEALQGYAFVRERPISPAVQERFRTLVPPYYLGLVDPQDPEDPIALMAFPQNAEADASGFRDPIGDLARQAAPRLTHRYPDRALLHVTNLCPMYCRFCFRKNLMNEAAEELYAGDFREAWEYLKGHPEVEELILTGGDPWMLSDGRLRALVDEIARLPHIKRLRFHTRMPVTLPSRVTPGLVEAIHRPGRFLTVVVTHFNHPRELSARARQALGQLRAAGVLLLNQAVLLKGVNDRTQVLLDLFRGLGEAGVMPYYLHHCDQVSGAGHFRLSLQEGKALWASLRGRLPGYLLPEYVLDGPAGIGKVPVMEGFVSAKGGGVFEVTRGGQSYEYREPEPFGGVN